jgi:hypothetical protein
MKCSCVDWFKNGKGPNPIVAELDRDMDKYFEDKRKAKDVDAKPDA